MVGSGTEGWSQVRMEHLDKVALTPEPGEEGTDGKERNQGQEHGLEKKKLCWEGAGKGSNV